MRAIWIAALAALIAACAGTTDEQSPAGVEERKPGAQTQPLDRKPIAAVDLTAGKKPALSLLKDPGSILSTRSIYYDFDKFDVKDEYKSLVEAHAVFLRQNPGMKMLIQGNTDERGSREYNIALGQRRSEGVRRMMVLLGVKDEQIEAVSLGEEKPKAEGHDEAAWAQNRRSDILYQGEY